MSAASFLLLAVNHIAFLLVVSALLVLLLYRATCHVSGGPSDPFHFYYAFTFGTSYAVVALLAYQGEIGLLQVAMVGGFGAVFVVGYRFFSHISVRWVRESIRVFSGGGTLFWLSVILYFVAAIFYVLGAGLPFLSESRFETNRGFGFLVRIMDPLRLFIIACLAMKIVGRQRRTFLYWALGLFAIGSSLLNGSKFALLESAYVASVAVSVRLKLKSLPIRAIVWPAIGILALATVFAFGVLLLNMDAIQAAAGGPAVSAVSVVVAGFVERIVGNGDMYYLGLPSQVLNAIHIDHPLVQLFGPIIGSAAASSTFGVPNIGNTDVGRQIVLYWDPNYPVAGGPTNHFDMTAYLYFGPYLGTLFVIGLALFLAQMNRLKLYSYSLEGCAVVAVLYCRSLPALLNPAIGIADIFDAVAIFLCLTVLSHLIIAASRGSVDHSGTVTGAVR